ncbi:GNAT family N-acetyltransferase [Aeromicrobium sp. IC_218]|uniref:GNAT family N-acetyltransferase n=1 Tax=Aeromicrobium sp. IC_218 TaxID=2545468 RepID=UPI0010388DC9|nr:GNAT family N-acetyltransferase [Aeromicrobium sp. IC_218]TCI98871.1 GNAT family N-acetyltransferase [Aeromicrobium sp. IC_218]
MPLDVSMLGSRVVVRHRVGGTGPGGGPAMTDVVGRLLALDEATARVERRDGTAVDVPLASVVAAKTVPQRPLRRRGAAATDAEELTRITSRGWPATESVPLGGWELRAAGGFTGRANSVAVHGDPGVAVDEALVLVEAFYAARDLPALAQVVAGSAWDRAFAEAGWVGYGGARPGAIVQVADLEPAYVADSDALVESHASEGWMRMYHRVEDLRLARAVLEGPATVGFVSIGSPAVAIGRVVVTGEWAGLAAVEVAPEARRQGLARRIVQTSLAWAVEHGADKAYLQTMRDNDPAIALYRPFGFTDHHEYRYLTPGR